MFDFVSYFLRCDPNFRVFYFAAMTAVFVVAGFVCLEVVESGIRMMKSRRRRRR